MSGKLKVIYIAGNGRSGSTLLEMLLGSLPNAFNIGEAFLIPFEWEHQRTLCECGAKIRECEFWQQTERRAGPLLHDKDPLATFQTSYQLFRFKGNLLPRILFRKFFRHNVSYDLWSEKNFQLLKIIQEEASKIKAAPVEYIVDASKGVYRLWYLLQSPQLEVKVIQVVKDPRAFVYSMTKNDVFGFRVLLRTIKESIRWKIENSLLRHAGLTLGKDAYRLIRYEDLAGHPQQVLQGVSAWLRLPYEAQVIHNFRQLKRHGIAGNKARHESRPIQLDEEWKLKLPWLQKLLTTFFASLSLRSFGYSWRIESGRE